LVIGMIEEVFSKLNAQLKIYQLHVLDCVCALLEFLVKSGNKKTAEKVFNLLAMAMDNRNFITKKRPDVKNPTKDKASIFGEERLNLTSTDATDAGTTTASSFSVKGSNGLTDPTVREFLTQNLIFLMQRKIINPNSYVGFLVGNLAPDFYQLEIKD
jgi:hypothetical protein